MSSRAKNAKQAKKALTVIPTSSTNVELEKAKRYALLEQFDRCAPALNSEMVIEWDDNGLPK
jgi:hypothetical protein